MQQILIFFWQMCLFRASPDKLPANWFPLALTFTAYTISAIISLLVGRGITDPVYIVGSVGVGIAIQAGIVIAVLALKRVMQRFAATMSALLGTNTIILLILLPVTVLVDVEQTTIRTLAESILLASFIWWLTIAGFILHRAAGISMLQGIAIALGAEMIVLSATFTLFPDIG